MGWVDLTQGRVRCAVGQVTCVVVIIPGLITAFCVPERSEYCCGTPQNRQRLLVEEAKMGSVGFFAVWLQGMRLLCRCRAYLILMVAFLSTATCFQVCCGPPVLCPKSIGCLSRSRIGAQRL